MKNKTWGWVIEDIKDRCFLADMMNADSLKDATVYDTRKEARKRNKLCGLVGDIIRKVALDYRGRAVAIIPGR